MSTNFWALSNWRTQSLPSTMGAHLPDYAVSPQLSRALSTAIHWCGVNSDLFNGYLFLSRSIDPDPPKYATSEITMFRRLCRSVNRTRVGRRVAPSGVRLANVFVEPGSKWPDLVAMFAVLNSDHLLYLAREAALLYCSRMGVEGFAVPRYKSFSFSLPLPYKRAAIREKIRWALDYWPRACSNVCRPLTIKLLQDPSGSECFAFARFSVAYGTLEELSWGLWTVLYAFAGDWSEIRLGGGVSLSRSLIDWSVPQTTVLQEYRRFVRRVCLFGDALKNEKFNDLKTL